MGQGASRGWFAAASEAVNVLFALAQRFDVVAERLLWRVAREVFVGDGDGGGGGDDDDDDDVVVVVVVGGGGGGDDVVDDVVVDDVDDVDVDVDDVDVDDVVDDAQHCSC